LPGFGHLAGPIGRCCDRDDPQELRLAYIERWNMAARIVFVIIVIFVPEESCRACSASQASQEA